VALLGCRNCTTNARSGDKGLTLLGGLGGMSGPVVQYADRGGKTD
jgi:hypothetical protein